MRHAGLHPTLALSLLAHAAAFALIVPLAGKAVAPGRPPADLQVSLAPPAERPAPGPRSSGAARPATKPPPGSHRATPAAEVAPSAMASPREPDASVMQRGEPGGGEGSLPGGDAASPASAAPAPAAVSSASREADAERIIGRLNGAVRTHFYYPPLARRKGWQGQVTVGVRVQPDGRLTDIRVIESSGHRVLDGAAVDCLVRAARLPGIRHSLEAGMDLVLPVKYLLIDSPA
jgi:protein TonB